MKLSGIGLLVAVAMMNATIESGAVEIIGHRGASHDAPENTLGSINLAWQRGADAVEIDVLLSKDGRIVVIHDDNTKRLGGRDKLVKDQTLLELKALDVGRWKGTEWAGQRVPTLSEVLATIPKGKRLFIEIKCGPEIVPRLKKVLEESGKPPRQTVVIGFSIDTMRAVKQALPKREVAWIVRLKQNKQTGKWSPSVEELIRKAHNAGLDGLDLGKSPVINREFIGKVKQAKLSFYVWTVNSPEEAKRLKQAGVDGITTDRPGWLRQKLANRGARQGL